MDWTRILTNVAGEFFAPTTAAYALAAIGLNIHFGLTGLLNMGQAGFMLLGAYGFAIATIAGWPLWAAVLIAIAAATVFALILGIPTLKLRGDYLAIVTIAAAEIVRLVGRSTALTRAHRRLERSARQPVQGHVPGRVAVRRRRPGRSARSSTPMNASNSWWIRIVALGRRRARLLARLAPHPQPLGPRAQGHPRGRGRRALARQERLHATRCRRSCSAASSGAGRHPLRAATSRPARLHGPIHDVLHLDDPAARRGGDRVRPGARVDHLLGGPHA